VRRDPLSRRAIGILAVVLVVVGAVVVGRAAADRGGPPAALTIESAAGQRTFVPASARVAAGSAVRLLFRNRSDEAHNLTFLAPLDVGTDTIVEAGGEQILEFAAPARGSYRFFCTIHPGMEGVLDVE
jgi:plastocyanin